MSKKSKYLLGGVIAIILSYVSAVVGSNMVNEGLIAWHTIFSMFTGVGGMMTIINNLIEM